jgi:serine phosphatase RsbU (regulator of sigma subunit)
MVTAIVACYQPDTRVLTWARAGHPPPLLCEPDGTTRFLEDVNATPLGTIGKEFPSAQVELAEDALVVFYTDGLIERRDRIIDEGLEWLAQQVPALHTQPVDTLCSALVERAFVSNPSGDDVCVLVLRAATQ